MHQYDLARHVVDERFTGIARVLAGVVDAGGRLAIAVRKNSPQLVAALNKFMGSYGLGSSFGNQIERKYLESTKYAKSATSEANRKKLKRK